jgi:hypothetical protein
VKKYPIVFLLVLVPIMLNAQVFGTGQTMRRGATSIGINPALYLREGDDELYLYIHVGHGIRKGLDLGAKVSVVGEETYFGADLEWRLSGRSPYISISAGGHKFWDFGVDATLNVTFPLKRRMNLYFGGDMDIEFTEPESITPFWAFVGLDIGLSRKIALLLEGCFGINDEAWDILSGGLNFYL